MIALAAGRDPDKNKLSKESLAAAEDDVKFKILQKAEQRIKAVRSPWPHTPSPCPTPHCPCSPTPPSCLTSKHMHDNNTDGGYLARSTTQALSDPLFRNLGFQKRLAALPVPDSERVLEELTAALAPEPHARDTAVLSAVNHPTPSSR